VVEEHFFYVFYLLTWRKNILFAFFIFRRGGRTFLLHFLSSAMAEERSFSILLSSATAEERPFLVFLSSPVEEEHSFSIGFIELTFF